MRLELTRSCDHYPLKVACIPISPPARSCANAQRLVVPRTGLEPAHLAACAPETHASTNSAIWAKKKSGKRDSNSRPRPWQGRALPTELFPHAFCCAKEHCFSKAGAKVLLFFEMTKYFVKKMQKKCKLEPTKGCDDQCGEHQNRHLVVQGTAFMRPYIP